MAEARHLSLILFFWGPGDIILYIDTGVPATVVPVAISVCLYLHCLMAGPHFQASFRISSENFIVGLTIFSFVAMWSSLQAWSMELRQEQAAMNKTKGRMIRTCTLFSG